MSSGTTSSDRLTEALDSVVAEDAQQGRLDDTEIQRLVVLSRDAAYQRSERVPVKTVEVFQPRSLVSIAMEAQRRREAAAMKRRWRVCRVSLFLFRVFTQLPANNG